MALREILSALGVIYFQRFWTSSAEEKMGTQRMVEEQSSKLLATTQYVVFSGALPQVNTLFFCALAIIMEGRKCWIAWNIDPLFGKLQQFCDKPSGM